LGAEGINVEDGVHILLADNGPEIASAIDRILSSSEIRNRLTTAARALVVSQYDWAAIGERLYGIHRALVGSRARDLAPNRSEP
jgi:glycosyltransferase involved in cell wall biosynthesis